MNEFNSVRTVAAFQSLEEGEILEGYLDGFHGGPPPNPSDSPSYWHGWRNGMVDSQRQSPDFAYKALAQDFKRLPSLQHHASAEAAVQPIFWDMLSN